jgi:hypothetical protein
MNTIILPPEVVAALNNNQNKIAIVAQLLSKRGQISTIETRRPLKLLSKFKKLNTIGWKYSTMQVRSGVDYENTQYFKDKREDENSKPEAPIGREWLYFPYILRTTSDNPKLLFRFYTVNNNFKPKTKYVIDNHEVQKEDLPTYCLASEYQEREQLPCFDLSIDTIEAVK